MSASDKSEEGGGLPAGDDPYDAEAEDRDSAHHVARFQAGEREAFSVLYARYFDRIYSYLRTLLRDRHEAEDVTQQVFMDALGALPRFEYTGVPVRVWLFTIARNSAMTRLRRLDRVEPVEPVELDRSRDRTAGNTAEPARVAVLTDRELMMFVERLPVAQRQVLALRHFLGLTNVEIAEMLDRSPNDVAVLHRRALAFLRRRLAAVRHPAARGSNARMRVWNPQAPVLRSRRFALMR